MDGPGGPIFLPRKFRGDAFGGDQFSLDTPSSRTAHSNASATAQNELSGAKSEWRRAVYEQTAAPPHAQQQPVLRMDGNLVVGMGNVRVRQERPPAEPQDSPSDVVHRHEHVSALLMPSFMLRPSWLDRSRMSRHLLGWWRFGMTPKLLTCSEVVAGSEMEPTDAPVATFLRDIVRKYGRVIEGRAHNNNN